MSMFDIASRGTADFKGRLHEAWLARNDNRRQAAHNTMAALVELAVAAYINDSGGQVTNLAAWGCVQCDIQTMRNGHSSYIEVKFLPDTPEEYELRLEAARSDLGVAVGHTPDPCSRARYLIFRVSEAVMQLRRHGIERNERIVWIAVDAMAEYEISALPADLVPPGEWGPPPYDWCPRGSSSIAKIVTQPPRYWLVEAGRVMVSTWRNFQLDNTRAFM